MLRVSILTLTAFICAVLPVSTFVAFALFYSTYPPLSLHLMVATLSVLVSCRILYAVLHHASIFTYLLRPPILDGGANLLIVVVSKAQPTYIE